MGAARQWAREPGRGRYAKPERERRFLLDADPPPGKAARTIEDRYLVGTRLRLRHVAGDGHEVFKLTQKVRVRDEDPSDLLITNLYLTEHEYAGLCCLPSKDISKTRSVHPLGEHDLVVDVFHGRLGGLRLAEVQLTDLDAKLALPAWVGHEITHDDRFSGGGLAFAADDELRALLAGLPAGRNKRAADAVALSEASAPARAALERP